MMTTTIQSTTSSTLKDTAVDAVSEGVALLSPRLFAAGGRGKDLLRQWPGLKRFDPALAHEIAEGIAIHWGEHGLPANEMWPEINSYKSILRLKDEEQQAALLRINRIPAGHFDEEPAGIYRVLVCDHNFCVTARRGMAAAVAKAARKARAERMAARAIYCLGLDFARVDIGVFIRKGRAPRLSVMRIDPKPKLSRKTAVKFAAALQDTVGMMQIEEAFRAGNGLMYSDLTLGADPEFALRHQKTKKMLMASRFFTYSGRVGHDARPMSRKSRRYPLVEIRCPASTGPHAVFREIFESLQIAHRRLPRRVEWLAGSQPFPGVSCGGHLHVGGMRPNHRIMWALDHYLGIPLLLCEQTESARTRRERYGFLGDVRSKQHGGFEYRSPASWLYSPNYTYAAIALFWLVVRNYPLLRADWLWSHEAQQAFYEANDTCFRPLIDQIFNDLTMLPDFDEVADVLEWFFEQISQGRKWPEERNFRRQWFPRAVGHRRGG